MVGAATPSSGVFGGGISNGIGRLGFLDYGDEGLLIWLSSIRPRPAIPIGGVLIAEDGRRDEYHGANCWRKLEAIGK